jgi:rhodanese-related sulfurtransferase
MGRKRYGWIRPDEVPCDPFLALSLNEDRWNELLPQFLAVWSPGKKIVVYCSSLSCNASREVARRLRKEAQIPDVFVLEGGWEAWVKKNR